MKKDEKTQVSGTNDYSIQSKYSLVRKGYIDDPYLKYFVANQYVSRSPIINWGYFLRHRALEHGIATIENECQDSKSVFVVFGAGFDTRALRKTDTFFVELDYASVCQRKARIIIHNDLVETQEYSFHSDRDSGVIFSTPRHVLIGCDFRNKIQLDKVLQQSRQFLTEKIFDFYKQPNSIRYIFVNECALCYIEQLEGTDALLVCKDFFENLESEVRCSFSYLAYEMFENRQLKNRYTEFMKNHFIEMGAEILHFPTRNDIQKRCKILGLKSVEILTAKDVKNQLFLSDSVIRDEKLALEPFDEWEDLDTVAMCYTLTIATQGSTQNRNCDIEDSNLLHSSDISPTKVHSSNILSVFDHCSLITLKNSVLIIGGFGIEPQESFEIATNDSDSKAKGHRRFKNVIELTFDEQSKSLHRVNVVQAENPDSFINRVHCRAAFLTHVSPTKSRYIVSGGRESPNSIKCNAILEVDSENDTFQLTEQNEFSHLNRNCVRAFRHMFCAISRSKSFPQNDTFVQFGGFQTSQNSEENLNVLQIYEAVRNEWSNQCIHSSSEDFFSRHSMAFVAVPEHSGALIHGGLNVTTQEFYQGFDIYDSRSSELIHFEIPEFSSRYSHQIVSDNNSGFWILGGISSNGAANDVAYLDMRTRKVLQKRYISEESTLLMQKFTAHLMPDFRTLITVGGGGNCFSFGTNFNPILEFTNFS